MKFRVIAAALLLVGQASAQLPSKKPNCDALSGADAMACMEKYGDCSTPGWLSPPQREECAAREAAVAASTLQADRTAILKLLDQNRRQALRKADAAFDKFVEATCDFDASEYAGGSMYSEVHANCMAHWSRERAKQYKRIRMSVEEAARPR